MLQPVFVHFPHPGSEHNPGRAERQTWNTNPKHRRKFLRGPGRYVGPEGALADALLAFWAEWEPRHASFRGGRRKTIFRDICKNLGGSGQKTTEASDRILTLGCSGIVSATVI